MSNLESIALLVLLDGVPELLSMLGQSNDADKVRAAQSLVRRQADNAFEERPLFSSGPQ